MACANTYTIMQFKPYYFKCNNVILSTIKGKVVDHTIELEEVE